MSVDVLCGRYHACAKLPDDNNGVELTIDMGSLYSGKKRMKTSTNL